jgi:hypothetical protein
MILGMDDLVFDHSVPPGGGDGGLGAALILHVSPCTTIILVPDWGRGVPFPTWGKLVRRNQDLRVPFV